MIYTVSQDKDGFYIVKFFDKEIIRKSTLLQATKALTAFQKGRA